jgi:hypothetical protein
MEVKYQNTTFVTHCYILIYEFCERHFVLTEGGELYKKIN